MQLPTSRATYRRGPIGLLSVVCTRFSVDKAGVSTRFSVRGRVGRHSIQRGPAPDSVRTTSSSRLQKHPIQWGQAGSLRHPGEKSLPSAGKHPIQRSGMIAVRCTVGRLTWGAGMAAPGDVRAQLELVGLDEALRLADTSGGTPAERARLRRRVEI